MKELQVESRGGFDLDRVFRSRPSLWKTLFTAACLPDHSSILPYFRPTANFTPLESADADKHLNPWNSMGPWTNVPWWRSHQETTPAK